jgi:ABC-type Fe3+-hydroxamate transport system substrate-binding protein
MTLEAALSGAGPRCRRPQGGTFTRPDLEAITAVHPSLILTSTTVQRELAATLRAKGYRVQHLEPASRLSKSAKRWARPKMHPQWCEK